MEAAGIAKGKVEDAQRERVKAREASGETHKLRFFMPMGEKFMPIIDIDRWETFEPSTCPKLNTRSRYSLPKDPDEMVEQIKAWIFAGPAEQTAPHAASRSTLPRKYHTPSITSVQSTASTLSIRELIRTRF